MDLKQALRYVLFAGTFAIPFIPFLVTSSLFFPFITGKNFAFRIIVEIMAAAFLLLALIDKTYRPKLSIILISILSFVGIIALADIFGARPFKSIFGNFERMEGLIALVHLALYALIIGTFLKTEKLWDRLFQTSVGASALIALFGVFQLLGVFTINQGGDRLDATFGNATYLAVYMLFHLFITAILFVRTNNIALRYVYGALIPLQLIILFFTGTRGTILGLIGGILLAALFAAFTGKKKVFKYGAVGTVIAVLIVIGGFIAIKDTSFVKDNFILHRFSTISLEAGETRFTIWSMALDGVKERPILGWGQENFNFVFNKYYQPELYNQEPWFDRTHNVILDWAVAGGILGLLAYLSLPLVLLYYLWIKRRETEALSNTEKSIITGLIAGYFFHNLFVFDNLISYILFFTILAYVHSAVTRKEETGLEEAKEMPLVAASAILIVLLGSLYFFNIKAINASATLIDAMNAREDLSENVELFKKAHAYNTTGRQEVAEQFLLAASATGRGNAPAEVQQLFAEAAFPTMQKEIDAAPNDARLQILMASTLGDLGLYAEAVPYAEKAQELSPRKQQILFKLGEIYTNSGQTERGLRIFKEAYELAPEFEDAIKLYAVAAIFNRDLALAEELLVPRFGTMDVDDDRILNAYVSIEAYSHVVGIWEARVEKDPANAQKRLSLAAGYLALGNRTLAIVEVQKVIEIAPEFKAQGESIINDIRAGRTP